jgi:hypothetical protein
MHKTVIRVLRKKLHDLESSEQDLKVTELTHQALDLLLASDSLRLEQEAIVEALWAENRKLYSDLQAIAKELSRVDRLLTLAEMPIVVHIPFEAKVAVENALTKDYHEVYGESIKDKVPK